MGEVFLAASRSGSPIDDFLTRAAAAMLPYAHVASNGWCKPDAGEAEVTWVWECPEGNWILGHVMGELLDV
jgi:hypothetical protein